MSFKLPCKAEEYFNTQASEMLPLLEHRVAPRARQGREIESSDSHAFIAANFDESNISNFSSIENIDLLGRQSSRFFHVEQGWFGFSEENYFRIEKLIKSLSEEKELRNVLSEKFLMNMFFEWAEKRYKNTISAEQDFVHYVQQKSSGVVKERKISIPIPFLVIEKAFRVGNITFEYYTRDFFDNFENMIKENARQITLELEENLRRIRKNYQGKVFASISLQAETEKCIEIAKLETDKSLTILRFFSPSALLPEVPSYFGRMGHVNIPVNHIFIFDDALPIIQSGIDEKREYNWHITQRDIQNFEASGIQKANDLLTKEKLTGLEETLLNCIFLYNRGIVSKETHDKLVFTLVSVETLLLKNESEPIQSSVGLRLSFLSGSTVDNRKKIIKLVKDCYQQRSRYIHHGRQESDEDLLRNLQICVWTALRKVIVSKDQFTSQDRLIEFIEDKILSG
jgi:hypothetical protein